MTSKHLKPLLSSPPAQHWFCQLGELGHRQSANPVIEAVRMGRGIFSCTPEPHIAFCPIFVHPLFPVFEPHIQKWVIFVRRRPLTLLDSNPSPSPEKRSILAPTPSSSLAQTARIDLPECQERRGAKTIWSVFFEMASPAESRRRLHNNTAYAHLWGFSRKAG